MPFNSRAIVKTLSVLLLSSAVFVCAQGKLVIVMDDLGNQQAVGRRAVDIPWVTTIAIMPGRPYSQELAERAHNLNKEIIIHAPMSNSIDFPLGPLGLDKRDGRLQIEANIRASIKSLPHAVGMSNHMGSRLTQDREAMTWVMAELKRQNLYFFDSRTVSSTVAWEVADEMGLAWSMRNLFLDHYQDHEFLSKQWDSAVRRVRNGETVTVICHPYDVTLEFFKTLTVATDIQQSLLPLSAALNAKNFAQIEDYSNVPETVN